MSNSSTLQSTAASFPTGINKAICCPNCQSQGMQSFYAVDNIPVHSCLLMPTREEAINYPTGQLHLGFCPSCGFVGNTAFDPQVHEYSARYEETQGFSPTFNTFARRLAQDLVDKHKLGPEHTVLEIGCGKGEFLVLMCELGGCKGIGLDPGYRPERTQSEAADRIEFIVDFYGPKFAHLTADFICCRHTLEHIAPTHAFMTDLRKTIGDRTDTVVFFELPDVMRELKEGAFWDLYYEHCTYFSAGSLARLFRQTGFDVTELDVVYAGQYLLITALPAPGPTPPSLPLENDLLELRERIAAFPAVTSAIINHWKSYVDANAARGRKIVLWGSGSKGVSFLTTLRIGDEVEYVVDINPFRQGKFMPGTGQQIVGPDFLAASKPDCVIVMNPVYVDEIRQDLEARGLHPELVAV
jgi:SAM-dependent methyltransferase